MGWVTLLQTISVLLFSVSIRGKRPNKKSWVFISSISFPNLLIPLILRMGSKFLPCSGYFLIGNVKLPILRVAISQRCYDTTRTDTTRTDKTRTGHNLDASFYSPCQSKIYVDSSSLNLLAKFFQVLIEIVGLQKWLPTHLTVYSE